jgi:hypothetical protein
VDDEPEDFGQWGEVDPVNRQDPLWEPEGKAVRAWARGHRNAFPTAPQPRILTVGQHIGRAAAGLAKEGVGLVELIRLFEAAGADDVCPRCGMTSEAIEAEYVAKHAVDPA